MGCGSSSHARPSKKDTRAQSQVTVAAQQRAEAAYRRQRMAQERAEQTAVWRAEMEVERARMLKEMSGGGSRRSSYCKELEDLKERAPEVSDHLNGCLQDYKFRTKNARNSLPVNAGYPHSTVISQRRSSREEREKRAYYRQKEQENVKNGNEHRKLSTGEKIDLDFLRTIANRSSQNSPRNVQIEENVPDRDEAQSSDTNAEEIENLPFKGNDGMRSEETKKNDGDAITERFDASKEHVADNPVDSQIDVTPTDSENVSSTHEDPTIVPDNSEHGDHSSVERSSDMDTKNVANRFKHEDDVDSVTCSSDKGREISVDHFNEEQSQISNKIEDEPEKQVGG